MLFLQKKECEYCIFPVILPVTLKFVYTFIAMLNNGCHQTVLNGHFLNIESISTK